MTTLLFIRHGQASFDSDEYDRLSDLGRDQATITGTHLRREGRAIDAAISGTLRRQMDTASLALGAAESPLTVVVDPAFDEYASDGLFKAYLPVIASRDPEIPNDMKTVRGDRKLFQRALSEVMALWLAEAPGHEGETSAEFRDRIRAGMDRAVEGRGKDDVIAVFTSGGVIGAVMGEALGLTPAQSMVLSWRVINASVTEIGYGRNGFSVTSFNGAAHLRLAGREALVTHR